MLSEVNMIHPEFILFKRYIFQMYNSGYESNSYYEMDMDGHLSVGLILGGPVNALSIRILWFLNISK